MTSPGRQEEYEAEEARFAESVKQRREAKGWNQTELAKRMVLHGWKNFTQMTISRTEKGERPIRLSEARALAEVLGATVSLMIAPPEDAGIVEELAYSAGAVRLARRHIYAALSELERAKETASYVLHANQRRLSEISDPAMRTLFEEITSELEGLTELGFMDIVRDAEGAFWRDQGYDPDATSLDDPDENLSDRTMS